MLRLLVLGLLLLPPLSAGEPAIAISVAGVRVVAPPPPGVDLRAFNWDEVLAIALLARGGDVNIIGLDESGTRVASLVDDRGTDLAPKDGAGGLTLAEAAADGRACLLNLEASRLPAAGAGRVQASGVLGLRVATGSGEVKVALPSPTAGQQLTAGPATFTIAQAGMGVTVPGRFSLTLRCTAGQDAVRGVAVRDVADAPIAVQQLRRVIPGSSATDRVLVFPGQPGPLILVVSLWEGLATVPVPFAIDVGLGL